MSGNLSSGADIRWNGEPKAGYYYCQLTQRPSGNYSLPNSYTPQILYSRGTSTWSAVWPAENSVYTVKVTKNETSQQLPDLVLLNDAKKALEQRVSAEYFLYKYNPRGILEVNSGNPAIAYEAVQFGSENPTMGPPWAMSKPLSARRCPRVSGHRDMGSEGRRPWDTGNDLGPARVLAERLLPAPTARRKRRAPAAAGQARPAK
jgi:hypothetical protein